MTQHNKVVWSEGLFLRPQHMQQQECYLERYVDLAPCARPWRGAGRAQARSCSAQSHHGQALGVDQGCTWRIAGEAASPGRLRPTT